MKDCLGKELQLGDKIVTTDRNYADLIFGEVIGFTPKKVRVKYNDRTIREAIGVSKPESDIVQLKLSHQLYKIETANYFGLGYEKAIKDLNEPMKVIEGDRDTPSRCPQCNRDFIEQEGCKWDEGYKYFKCIDLERCPYCGQRLEWQTQKDEYMIK